jgi:hypothetical protein
MAEAQTPRDAIENVVVPARTFFGFQGRRVLVVEHGAADDVGTCHQHALEQTQAHQFGHAPRLQVFTPHAVDMHRRFFQEQHPATLLRQNGRERATGDARADDHDLVRCAHAIPCSPDKRVRILL